MDVELEVMLRACGGRIRFEGRLLDFVSCVHVPGVAEVEMQVCEESGSCTRRVAFRKN